MGSPVVPLNKMNFKFLLAVFVVAVALVPTPTEADRPRIPGSLASLDLEQIFSSPEPLRNRTSAITGYMSVTNRLDKYTASDKGCRVRNIRCFPSTRKGTIIRRGEPCSLTKLTTNIFTVHTAGNGGDSCIIKQVLNPTPAANGQQ